MKNSAPQSGLHALALRESSGPSIRNRLQSQLRDYLIDALAQFLMRNAAKPPKVRKVFPHREPRIQSNVVQQRPNLELPLGRVRSVGGVVDSDAARLRFQYAT